MRKCMALILSFMILLGVCPAGAEDVAASPVYSAEAAVAFCNAWNAYFAENDVDISVGCFLSDDGKQLEGFDVMLNDTRADFNFTSGLIPSDATLYLFHDIPTESVGFCVIADELKGELEDVEKIIEAAIKDIDKIVAEKEKEVMEV